MFRFVDSWQDIMDHQTALTGSEPAGPRRPELLAPAGGPGPFAAALAAGADAIYCGMGSFNARRKADNFTDESFAAACLCGTGSTKTPATPLKEDGSGRK